MVLNTILVFAIMILQYQFGRIHSIILGLLIPIIWVAIYAVILYYNDVKWYSIDWLFPVVMLIILWALWRLGREDHLKKINQNKAK